ncbi:MAG TPA: hypothetical protein VNP98_00295 [Chthoniobacterales bacterium]|nr:hypothetical protein [Chthoniobacterales bacterium]
MNLDADPSDEFVLMGTYSIVDARKLLTAFEEQGVDHRVEFRDGAADINPVMSFLGGAFGQAAQATVRVAPEHKELADRIHADLFGDCLPNYDASFFTDSETTQENPNEQS